MKFPREASFRRLSVITEMLPTGTSNFCSISVPTIAPRRRPNKETEPTAKILGRTYRANGHITAVTETRTRRPLSWLTVQGPSVTGDFPRQGWGLTAVHWDCGVVPCAGAGHTRVVPLAAQRSV
ncbi:hypothetical protein GCM10010503_60990 [Streptomyces lucensis JCM 4490]|uniref:Uncharacterized protein n=1 Tax=Streptomyces lucensis JCM 4490 TaxID=1306176 RepID=A0A918JCX7_9ACTN|nr:hypothetical protein GCM10010503_60990 [Streptomyces lucensis JCM 4490]